MNCFACRRRLLSSPLGRSVEQQSHLAQCEACARYAAGLADLEGAIESAALVRVPDALSERVLLGVGRRPSPRRRYAFAAAAVLVASIALGAMVPMALDAFDPPVSADTVGPQHPAVAAISLVVDQEPALLREGRTGDPLVMEQRLKHLGLALPKGNHSLRYIGKCDIAGGDCDHLVLVTPDGHASVILVPGEHTPGRVLVADRRMTALLSQARSGAYIVVAESPKAVKRAQKLFVKG